MNEEIIEQLAQLQYENSKLLDELNHLKEHTFSIEETLNAKCSELLEEKKKTKSLELQNGSLSQVIRDKDFLIDSLEHEKKKFKQLHTKLSSENLSLKGELLQEKLKNRQMEILKTKEEELKKAYASIKEENQKLIFELSVKSEECLSNAAAIKEFLPHIKELENEKAELMAVRDTLLIREKEERLKTSENLELLLRKSSEWSKSQMNLFDQVDQDLSFNKDVNNLREEILEVELREKQKEIGQLEILLRRKEEKELERKKSIEKLKRELNNAGLLNCDWKVNLKCDLSVLYNIYSHLLEIINWPEGQSGECKPLTEMATLSVVVKDGVQTTQPSSVRIIETISIASQTDPIKNLSPVLPFKTLEKLHASLDLGQSRSDSDDEGEGLLPFIEKDKMQKSLQLFSEPKNCDLDMDMYRSCRKLSVLPEEDVDEFLHRKNSLKKTYKWNLNNSDSKTHSADDITKVKTFKSSLKATCSCSNMISKNCKLMEVSEMRGGNSLSHSDSVKNTNLKLGDKKDNELQLPMKFPKDAFRQPHSFDSYLDPLKTQNSSLPRQISDPTQNTVFAPSVIRRGSYIRKPKSTCRPLTLPCDEGDRRKEERICKVRFDLAKIAPEKDDMKTETKVNHSSSYNNNKKIKMVSRFTVEIIDEVEFRKSIDAKSRNDAVTRKRPPLIHSVVYKKSVLRNLKNFAEKNLTMSNDVAEMNSFLESPDSPMYDTATEESPVESFDTENLENNCVTNDSYSLKRKRESNLSSYSFEDSQDSSEGSDILIKSIKLHTNSECIVMKELKKENSDSSCSNADSDIPYVDAEDLPVVKPSPDLIKISPVPEIFFSENQPSSSTVVPPGSLSEGSDTYLTPCDETPVSENHEISTFGSLKSVGLFKSPTVLKNLANFELLAIISDSRKLTQSEILEEEEKEDFEEKKTDKVLKTENNSLKRTSSDVSEASESDTLTYGTVKSHLAASSDCDSDTYVTVWSDKSFGWERKFSDLSENSSSPYNTPPDTSSASFCTPPDTYSPILNSVKNHSTITFDKTYRSLGSTHAERKREEFCENYETTDLMNSSPPFYNKCESGSENIEFFNLQGINNLKLEKQKTKVKNCDVIFDSPKLEFYETNDYIENLEAFLQKEEDFIESESEPKSDRPVEIKSSSDPMLFETEEFREALSKRDSLESPKLLEKRGKKHPLLSRQNSTEEYNFLDPHDSCLNLSEEVSSPSTTPDTSNKTVIFKNVPLTVSNTIDLDDDFPISEAEIQVNLNGSQAEILEVTRLKEEPIIRYLKGAHCLSEPCTPSVSSADFLEFSVHRKQRSSFTEESLMCGKFEADLPEIIVSHLSSESENSDLEAPAYAEMDFTSNVSDRMSKRSDSPISDILDGSSLDLSVESSASDINSDNSRDVNLNVKKFADCNLFGAELENRNNKYDEYDINLTSEVEILNSVFHLELCKNQRIEAQEAKRDLKLEINLESENPTHLPAAKKNWAPLTTSSTPKPESAESHALCNLFSISTNGSSTETENEGQTYLVAKTALSQSTSLTNEEINKKFQDLSFAFKTDSMTIQERLQLMKRRRDQAESNIENELRNIKAKLKTLQYLGLNSEYVNLMADLKKQLDFVLNATVQLSSSAEGYGYAQHEERLLELVAIMLQHVENIESSKNDSSDKKKEGNKRSPVAIALDNIIDDDKILRRPSVTAIALEGNSRRRASIATLPRVGYLVLENGSSGKGSHWTSIRPGGIAVKKLSFSQASSRSQSNGLSGVDDSRRDSTGARHRRGSKSSEGSMKNINEFSEQQSSSLESEIMEESAESNGLVETNDSSLHLRQLFGCIEKIGHSNRAQDHLTVAYILRRIIEVNKLVISFTRFRWPENVFQYAPFYLTWYVVFVLTFVFIGGLFTGINGCFTYSCLRYSALWFAASTFFSFTRRFYRILVPLFLSFVFAMILFFLWLNQILLPQLSNEEIDSLFRTFGLEIRYLYGPPPI